MYRARSIALLVLVLNFACKPDDGTSDCDPGAAGCECLESTCMAGLVCSATNTCVFEDGESDSGAELSFEEQLCSRGDECNVLMPGISVQDCTDVTAMCTDEMITSEYADWGKEVEDCLEFSNCGNYLNCLGEMSECSPVEPSDMCGPECSYCWYGTESENNCPADYEGDGTCDCGCQFTDAIDCG